MQLRKRKRVNYLKPVAIVDLPTKLVKVETETKDVKDIPLITRKSKKVRTKLSSKPPILKRPSYRNISQPEIIKKYPGVTDLQSFLATLDKMVPIQDNLYYKDLKVPKFLGPVGYESLRLPDDISKLKIISRQVKNLIDTINEVEKEETGILEGSKTKYTPAPTQKKVLLQLKQLNKLGKVSDDSTLNHIANIHGINISDIKDIRTIKYNTTDGSKLTVNPSVIDRNEVKLISRRLNKPLLREKNNLLTWPAKSRKKKSAESSSNSKFANVPLYNSV